MDIGIESESDSFIYVDDTKILRKVNSAEDVDEFQDDLENNFYNWATENNMSFNALKFVVLRYGSNKNLKEETNYFSSEFGVKIDSLSKHKDLGVIMSSNGGFKDHIETMAKKVKQRIGWICRSFQNRSITFMRHMYVSLVRPYVDYCSQLWGPGGRPTLDGVEKL